MGALEIAHSAVNMIARLRGKIVEKKENAVVMDVSGIFYEVFVPRSVLSRIDGAVAADGSVTLSTHYYFQLTPSSGTPLLFGFLNELEKDFFLQFISVSGIGPKAAIKAIHCSIAEIAAAIDRGDIAFLRKLPGIGPQKAKDVIAKLQGKVSRFGLIEDRAVNAMPVTDAPFQEEALDVLAQLQYKRPEAEEMVRKALVRNPAIASTEELLNEIYKQRVAS
jgi:Holliday junction DNA helicase RuvA